jgi:hypothetical protein
LLEATSTPQGKYQLQATSPVATSTPAGLSALLVT